MKYAKLGALCCVLFVGAVSQAQVLNGGFESVSLPGADISGPGYWSYLAGNTSISNWTIGGNSVDIVDSTYPVHTGNYALDLAGTPGPGSITQALALTTGQLYEVTFWARSSGNPINMVLNTSAVGGGTTSQTYSVASGSWNQYAFQFTAGSSSVDLSFATDPLNSTTGNLFLDDIAIEAVPEPMTMVVLAAAGLAAARRKRIS